MPQKDDEPIMKLREQIIAVFLLMVAGLGSAAYFVDGHPIIVLAAVIVWCGILAYWSSNICCPRCGATLMYRKVGIFYVGIPSYTCCYNCGLNLAGL